MKIIVTGAAGFIGSYIFDELQAKGHEVIGIDNYSIGKYKHDDIYPLDLNKNKRQIEGMVKKFKPDQLYHLAAWAHEGLSQFCPNRITENNYNAYLNILVPCINSGVKKVIVASSISVYGDQKPPFTEDMPYKPVDIYAVSKVAIEQATKILSEVHDFKYVIVRPHNVYGPRQIMNDPYRNVVAIFINQILGNKPIYVYGDGEQKRAYSYITDVSPYIIKAAKHGGEVFNIGSEKEYTINQLIEKIFDYMGRTVRVVYLTDRPKEVKYAWSDHTKIKKLLNYKSTASLDKGIKATVKWAKSVGYQMPVYLNNLELVGDNTPETWKKKLI